MMHTIGERIEEILRVKNINKSTMAKDLNIDNSSVTKYCNGKISPSNTTITAICQKYGVREEWLRSGKGDMYLELSREQQIAKIMADITRESGREEYPFKLELISLISQMDEQQIENLKNMAVKLATLGDVMA